MAVTRRRIVFTLVGVLALILLGLGAAVAQMFVGLRPVENGREINGIRIVVDGFSSIGVIPTGPGRLALIDAGMDQSGAAIQAELERRDLTVDAVEAVFVTHGHGDHIGGIGRLPGARVMALEQEVPVVEGRAGVRSPAGRVTRVAPTGVSVSRALRDGETVTVGDVDIRVFAVPGHTAGSAAYLVRGVLFLGDSAQVESAGSLRAAPWLVSDDRAQNRASLASLARQLAGSRVDAIVPAHSGPASGIAALEAFARGTP